MPIPLALAIPGAVSLFSSLFGAKQQDSTATKIAKTQADAQAKANAISEKASADALAFTKGEADRSFRSSEASRRGNYDWDAARERRIGSIGEMVGLGPREIPNYVPTDPGAGGGGGGPMYPSRPENMPTQGEVDWASPQLSSQLSAFFKSRGVADSEVPYWVREAGNLVARGKEINDPNYANMRLAAADVFGGSPAPQKQTARYAPGSVGSIVAQPMPGRRVLTPALQAPPIVYDPDSLAGYAAGGY